VAAARRDGVDYVVAAIPLGGYVKLLDEREARCRSPCNRRLSTASPSPRASDLRGRPAGQFPAGGGVLLATFIIAFPA